MKKTQKPEENAETEEKDWLRQSALWFLCFLHFLRFLFFPGITP